MINHKISPLNPKDYVGQALITISYDDGRKNNLQYALPLHQKYDIPASFAIITNRMQGDEFKSFMTASEVKYTHDSGIEIVSHGVYHKSLEQFTKIDHVKLDYELKHSKEVLENILQTQVNSICVPFSAYNKSVVKHCRMYYKYVRINGGKFTDINLTENVVYSHSLRQSTTLEEVVSWIDSAIDSKSWITLMLHGIRNTDTIDEKYSYDITTKLLEQILRYITGVGKNNILPVRFNEMDIIQELAKQIK